VWKHEIINASPAFERLQICFVLFLSPRPPLSSANSALIPSKALAVCNLANFTGFQHQADEFAPSGS
jgi:hypothetical protein